MKKQIILPELISNGMVIQQNKPVTFWGRCLGCSEITVQLMHNSQIVFLKKTIVKDNTWSVKFDPIEAGGPYLIKIYSDTGCSIFVEKIYVGEVWICAGQSNMELPVRRVMDRYLDVLDIKEEDTISIFKVPEKAEFKCGSWNTSGGCWQKIKKQNIADISAISFFLAEMMHKREQIPIGIINISLGGAPIESWMDLKSLNMFPDENALVEKCRDDTFRSNWLKTNTQNLEEWQKKLPVDCKKSYTQKIYMPGSFAGTDMEEKSGVIWLYRKFDIPTEMIEKKAIVWLGTMVDSDDTFVNGVHIGATSYQYPPRKYAIPEGVLKKKRK